MGSKFFAVCIYISLIFFSVQAFSQNINQTGLIVGDSDIYSRGRQELDRTLDPQLNTVPVERIIEANALRNQILIKSYSANKAGVSGTGNSTSSKAGNSLKTNNSPGPESGTANSSPAGSNSNQAANQTVINNLQWNERGPTNIGGRTRGLMFDLGDKANGYKKVFAGGVGGGVWITSDITALPVKWSKVSDFFNNIAISYIVQNPLNTKVIYASTGEGFGVYTKGLGVWKSIDGGITWNQLTSTISFSYITSMLVDPLGSVYISADGKGIQKSADGGLTWKQVIGIGSFGDGRDGADLSLAMNGDLYAATGDFSIGEVFFSSASTNGINVGNAGTWVNITPDTLGLVTSSSKNWWRIKLACAPSDSNTVYGLFNGSGQDAVTSVQRYNALTNNWSVKTVPKETFSNKQGWYALALAVDPNEANTVIAGSLDMQKSTDGGSSWARLSYWANDESSPKYIHADHQNYIFAPASSARAIMGTDGGVSYSSSMNALQPSFITQNNGYDVTQFYAVALHPTDLNYALAGAQDNGTQQFTTTGLGPTVSASDGDGADTFIDQFNPKIQISSYIYNNRFLSVDGGINFKEVFFNKNGGFINPSDYDNKYQTLYAGNLAGTYFRWSQVALGDIKTGISIPISAFLNASVTNVTISPITHNRVFFGLNNGTVVIVDNANAVSGQTTIVLTPNTAAYAKHTSVSSISIDHAAEEHLIVTYSNYGITHVFETKNAFSPTPVWTSDDGNLPDMPVRWSMFYPGDSSMALIATELGVWTTNSLKGSSTTWLPTNTGLANTRVDMLKYRAVDQTLAAASYGRGLFTTTLPATGKLSQTITFADSLSTQYGAADFNDLASSTNSTLPITYTSGNLHVCTINSSGKIHVLTAGISMITATQNGNDKYSAAIPATQILLVKPATLKISALNKTKYYGDTIPLLTLVYAGFQKGDSISDLVKKGLATTTATQSSMPGIYAISASGAADSNYTFNYIAAALTISPAPSPVITMLSTMTAAAGTSLTIMGKYLFGATALNFGSLAARSFKVLSETSVSAIVGAGYTGSVALTTPTGTATYAGFQFVPVPVISSSDKPILLNGSSLVLTAIIPENSNASGTGSGSSGTNSPPAYTYQWIKNGFYINGAISTSYKVTDSGTYQVEIALNAIAQTSAPFSVHAISNGEAHNFTVIATPLICKGTTDGSISIQANQQLAYTATLSQGNTIFTYEFTSQLLIPNLATGQYKLSITIKDFAGFSQNYTEAISDFQLLTLHTATNNITKKLTLILGGSPPYLLNFNGQITTISDSLIVLDLITGTNRLLAYTGQTCQGVISRNFLSTDNLFAFPNPFITTFGINLGKQPVSAISVSMYSAAGQSVLEGSYANLAGILTITPTGLVSGVYLVRLITDGNESVFKIMKN